MGAECGAVPACELPSDGLHESRPSAGMGVTVESGRNLVNIYRKIPEKNIKVLEL